MKKTQVDNFKEGKVTPCCQLKAELSTRKKKIPVLNYQILLQGAKEPYNYFTLELPTEGTIVWFSVYTFIIIYGMQVLLLPKDSDQELSYQKELQIMALILN